jgi:hypothetical protein
VTRDDRIGPESAARRLLPMQAEVFTKKLEKINLAAAITALGERRDEVVLEYSVGVGLQRSGYIEMPQSAVFNVTRKP